MVPMKVHLDGDNCWPDLRTKAPEEIIHVIGLEVAMLVGGMSSGKSSVAFRFDLEDGRVVVAEASLDLLETAVKSMRAKEASIQPGGKA